MTPVLCLLVLLLVALASAGRVTIDGFTTTSVNLVYDPKGNLQPQSTTLADPAVLGGSRDIYITAPGGGPKGDAITGDCANPALGSSNPTVQTHAQTSLTPAGFFLSNPTEACIASGIARYDGTAAPLAGCDYYSVNCVPTSNLTPLNLAVATDMVIRGGADLDGEYIAVWLYSGSQSQNWCGGLRKMNPNTNGPTTYGAEFDIPISEFTSPANPNAASGLTSADFPQNCDLTQINAIEVQMVGGLNWDQTVYFFGYDVPDLISISGAAFDDCNCVGSTSSPKNGVTVQLFSGSTCSGNPVQTTSTSSNGGYTFSSVSPGTYTVCASSSVSTICSNSASSVTRSFTTSSSAVNFFYAVQSGSLVCPPQKDVTCGSDTSPATLGSATISAGCGTAGSVTQNPDSTQTVTCTAPGGVIQVITRSWTSGGQTCSQTINVHDRTGVVLTLNNVPANVNVDCNAPDPTDVPSASGSCSNPRVLVQSSGNNGGQCDTTTCSRSAVSTRTFTPTDDCGNTGPSATQTITRNCQVTCPTCPTCPPPVTIPVTVPVTQAPKPVVGPLNCKFICDDADSSAVATVVSLAVMVVLAFFAL